jgi:hypothetical protein
MHLRTIMRGILLKQVTQGDELTYWLLPYWNLLLPDQATKFAPHQEMLQSKLRLLAQVGGGQVLVNISTPPRIYEKPRFLLRNISTL